MTLCPEPFEGFSKIARLNRACVVTEKLDGTNALVYVTPEGEVYAGSRTRWISPGKQTDNYGFAAWVEQHKEELRALGPGKHFGEWYGQGIQHGYGLKEKRFALFDVHKWNKENPPPACCSVVPVLHWGAFDSERINALVDTLREKGSVAVPGQKAEGVVVYHVASGTLFKVTCEKDAVPKGVA